mmetsp:Transcript_1334/g.1725  ORF Transcript_1334/g.1725 Transcript_1334/m.1725 type:complete len:101 (+) Transcript_1334:376-678(+)
MHKLNPLPIVPQMDEETSSGLADLEWGQVPVTSSLSEEMGVELATLSTIVSQRLSLAEKNGEMLGWLEYVLGRGRMAQAGCLGLFIVVAFMVQQLVRIFI